MSEPEKDLARMLAGLGRAAGSLERWKDGAECPSEHTLAALAEGALETERAEAVREHLSRCGACLLDVRAALEELSAMEAEIGARHGGGESERPALTTAPATRTKPAPAARGLRLAGGPLAWAGLAAAAVIAFFLVTRLGGLGADPAAAVALARLDPLPARVPRGEVEGDAETAFREGLALYADGDMAAARDELRKCVELDPERLDAALYLGSCLLLLGEPDDALLELERASAAPGDAGLEARWQAAQALLALARPAEARVRLKSLSELGGPRSADARALLSELSALGL